jgi:hypothetical protein
LERFLTLKSYIKLYGPPVLKAIRELEKISIDMPEVCIMDTVLANTGADYTESAREFSTQDYFSPLGEISIERCDTIISKSGETLGEYDFFFEWFTEPTMEQIEDLIGKVDAALEQVGCKYTITTEK